MHPLTTFLLPAVLCQFHARTGTAAAEVPAQEGYVIAMLALLAKTASFQVSSELQAKQCTPQTVSM